MTIPAEAFDEIYPADLRPGSVFRFRESWALLVAYDDGNASDFLMLGGERAGQLLKVGPDMPRCLAVIPPFTWFPAVQDAAGTGRTERKTTSLTLTPAGPVIIGANAEGIEIEYFAFRLNGKVDRDYEPYGVGLRYTEWTIELQHPERPFVSLGTLFLVGAVR